MSIRTTGVFRVARIVFTVALALTALLLITGYLLLRSSLPRLDGDITLSSLKSPVTVNRDERGTVQLAAVNIADAMRALGYVHAQERFFEMDLARRSAAGELSELFGKAALDTDKEKRLHRFRAQLTTQWPQLSEAERAVVSAYTEGVNAGLGSLSVRPWQYLVLRTQPVPWREVDSLLVIAEMYSMLQLRSIQNDFEESTLLEQLRSRHGKNTGDLLFKWLKPLGGSWDAALDGSTIADPALPTPDQIDTRRPASISTTMAVPAGAEDDALLPGSNSWAVGGSLTAQGAAILANDMHLSHGVPNIWFRAELNIAAPTGTRRITGVTLPGIPALVAGSNGDIAWGFTNSYGRWFRWIPLEPNSAAHQHTGEKGRTTGALLTTHRETIAIKGTDSVTIDIKTSPWGPVARQWGDKAVALWWTAYEPGAINARLLDLMFASTIEEAISISQAGGVPHQNIVIVDKQGGLAWTIAGRMFSNAQTGLNASRAGFSNMHPLPAIGETGWLPAADYPLIKNPADHRLWSANNRQMGGEPGALIGDGGFDLGARARQIRDRLKEKNQFDERALYDIQLDAEARFMKRWGDLASSIAQERAAREGNAGAWSSDTARVMKAWNGRADVNQAGYRIARALRQAVLDECWTSWIRAAAVTPGPKLSWDGRFEYAAWQAVTTRALHLLPAPFTTWDEFLAAQLGKVVKELTEQNGSLDKATWGRRNESSIRHPFSRVLPLVGRILDMPAAALSGDTHMPRVAAPTFGASQRMVVSPGHEDRGIFTMPGGQSGHPLSPFYGAGHQDWVDGKATPLLPGEARHVLRLMP